MKVSPLFQRSFADIDYQERICAELRALRPPGPSTILDHNMPKAERDALILAKQQPSTRGTLMRSDAEQEAWLARPISTAGQTTAATKTEDLDRLIPARPMSPEEFGHIEAIRRRPKNSIGQSESPGSSAERRSKAVDALIFSPPAVLTATEIAKVTVLNPIAAPPALEPEPEKKASLAWGFKSLLPRFWGAK